MIFSNILDIYNFTANMLSSVEEQVEVAAENETPTVGICFQDIAEVITTSPGPSCSKLTKSLVSDSLKFQT